MDELEQLSGSGGDIQASSTPDAGDESLMSTLMANHEAAEKQTPGPAEGTTTAGDTPIVTPPQAGAGATPATTVQAQAAGQPPSQGQPGPIPYERHQAAVDNARLAGKAEVAAQFAWAKGVSADQGHEAVSLLKLVNENPEFVFRELAKQHGFTTGPAPAKGAIPGGLPKASLVTAEGQRLFSEEDVVTHLVPYLKDTILKELEPDRRTLKGMQEARQQEVNQEIGRKQATALFDEATKWPHFTNNKEAIGQRYIALVQGGAKDPEQAFRQAYHDVVNTEVYPKLEQLAEEKVRATAAKRVGASVGAMPNGQTQAAVTAKQVKPGDTGSLAETMRRRQAGGS